MGLREARIGLRAARDRAGDGQSSLSVSSVLGRGSMLKVGSQFILWESGVTFSFANFGPTRRGLA